LVECAATRQRELLRQDCRVGVFLPVTVEGGVGEPRSQRIAKRDKGGKVGGTRVTVFIEAARDIRAAAGDCDRRGDDQQFSLHPP